MIESMRTIILQNESPEYGIPTKIFFTIIQDILINRWNKNCTPLHCLAHSLNLKYYNSELLSGGTSSGFPPHMDHKLLEGRKEAFRWLYHDRASFDEVEVGFINFSTASRRFSSYDVLRDRGAKKPHAWWESHGAACPPLHELAMRILSQVTSSHCCERNCSTYGNLYNLKKSKLEKSMVESMVYVHTNLRLNLQEDGGVGEGKDKDVGCVS
jgi:hypothetical protein